MIQTVVITLVDQIISLIDYPSIHSGSDRSINGESPKLKHKQNYY